MVSPTRFFMPTSIKAWGTQSYRESFKFELEHLDAGLLPLQQGLTLSSHVADSKFNVIILSVSDDPDFIHVKAGIFYAGIIAGCSCADDPTPISEQNEYCEVLFTVNKLSAETSTTLLME